jgi:hypothetical protein
LLLCARAKKEGGDTCCNKSVLAHWNADSTKGNVHSATTSDAVICSALIIISFNLSSNCCLWFTVLVGHNVRGESQL